MDSVHSSEPDRAERRGNPDRSPAPVVVFTRDALLEHLEGLLADPRRRPADISLVLLTVDGFARIRTGLGQHIGDGVLAQFSARLRSTVRHNDLVGHLGGDDFVILCDRTGADAVAHVIGRVQDVTNRSLDDVPTRFHLTTNIGAATSEGSSEALPTAVDLIHRADDALRESRDGTRGRVNAVII